MAMKTTRRRVPQKQLGPYIHQSLPTVLPPHPSVIRKWLRSGDIEKLEAVVIQGQGHKLLGEYTTDVRVKAFLKTIPAYLARIDMIHEAAAKGNLTDLRTLLRSSNDSAFPRKKLATLALSKDLTGTGLLHKAISRDYRDMVRWLVDKFPGTVNVRDREGRTPLHYSGHSRDPQWVWTILREAGADSSLLDAQGHTAAYYMDHPHELRLPTTPVALPPGRFTSGAQGLVVKPANIRIWIHDQDVGRLQQVVWEGFGDKLRTETSVHPSVKNFLNAVPYIMGVVKDVHSAAVNNDLILLKRKTEPPVPKDILLTKDQNGLTPLHKAAGLGHVGVIKAILSTCPEAVNMVDREGRTPLHYAAAAKGSGAVYDLLMEHGADETAFDKKEKPPKYYIQHAKELDQEVLKVIPEAPRTASIFPPQWDWAYLRGEGEGKLPPPLPLSNGDSAFEDMSQGDSPSKQSPPTAAVVPPKPAVRSSDKVPVKMSMTEVPKRPQTYDIDEGLDEEEERGYHADTDEHYEAEYAEVEPEYDVRNRSKKQESEIPTLPKYLPGAIATESRPKPEESTTKGTDNSLDANTPVTADEERVRRAVEGGDIEQLAALVLSGEGELLTRQRSDQPDVQMFLNNVPIYLSKIERVHQAMKEGNLRDLQSALDRRKFAVARESGSPLRLTPLHVAVLYGRTSVLKFLAQRFPETLLATDTRGRTPLHYAAILPDNRAYYNMLVSLGADKAVTDNDGKTADFYLAHPDYLTYEQLLTQYESGNTSQCERRNTVPKHNPSDNGPADKMVVTSGFPIFGPDEGQYLANSLGQPLIGGLTEVANKRPSNPVRYLADYLYTYDDENNQIEGQTKTLEKTYVVKKDRELTGPPLAASVPVAVPVSVPTPPSKPKQAKIKELEAGKGKKVENKREVKTEEKRPEKKEEKKEVKVEEDDIDIMSPEPPPTAFKPVQRDEFGQTMLHFAMARTHGRNALYQLLQELDCNIAFRDELYRTPRDVAVQVDIQENVAAVDKYVVSLAATGQLDKLKQLLMEGYDHIVDVLDDNATIFQVASDRKQTAVLSFLESVNNFEDKRERLHRAIRLASDSQVQEMLSQQPRLAAAKNTFARCSLHVAVLNQHENLARQIAQHSPHTLSLGDNLMRTPLHYAMGVDKVESLSKILIDAGARRVVKDLKGRQPSYYFMNKSDIQKLQDEEETLRV